MMTTPDIYWIVVTGVRHSGQTTFLQTAADVTQYRDRRDMSIIDKDEYVQARNALRIWSARFLATGAAGAVDETALIDRYQNSLLVGELAVDDDTYMCLYEAPTTHYDAVGEALEQGLLGVVVMVDSTAPETFAQVPRIIDSVSETDVPCVVAANKQDLPNAVNAADVTVLLNLQHRGASVVPCVATQRQSVKEVLLTLLHRLQSDAATS
jgi:uncharacterized protein